MLKIISDGDWIAPDYANRFKLPPEFVQSVWSLVDTAKVNAAFVQRLELELADRLVNQIAAEIATDVKQILSDKEKREQIFGHPRPPTQDETIQSCDQSSGQRHY